MGLTTRGISVSGCLVGLALLTGCSGLPQAREMGDMALMRTLGIDGGQSVTVTASTGRRAKGLQREVEPPLVLTAQSDSISGGCLALQGQSNEFIFYGYVDQLLLGEALAEGGVLDALNYFSRDVELGLGTQSWIVRGTAEEAIRGAGETGVDGRLSTLLVDSEMGAAGITRSVGEVLSELLEDGASYLPGLVQSEEGVLLEAGYGVLEGDRLVGWLEGDAARGLELLEEQPPTDIFVATSEVGTTVSLQVARVDTTVKPVIEQGNLVGGTIHCHIVADVTEYSQRPTAQELERFCQLLAEQGEFRIGTTISYLQQWQVDCLGLERQMGMAAPRLWETIQRDFGGNFSALPLSITVTVEIETT